jgi:hypothetical protein
LAPSAKQRGLGNGQFGRQIRICSRSAQQQWRRLFGPFASAFEREKGQKSGGKGEIGIGGKWRKEEREGEITNNGNWLACLNRWPMLLGTAMGRGTALDLESFGLQNGIKRMIKFKRMPMPTINFNS